MLAVILMVKPFAAESATSAGVLIDAKAHTNTTTAIFLDMTLISSWGSITCNCTADKVRAGSGNSPIDDLSLPLSRRLYMKLVEHLGNCTGSKVRAILDYPANGDGCDVNARRL